MDKELNEDARTKQDLLYECSSLERKLSDEIIKNEHLEQQCKKQKEVIDKINHYIEKQTRMYGLSMSIELGTHLYNILDILKEVSE